MKLKQIRLRNFRCFKDEISIDFEDITALIGKNDSGKSSIMEALDIFLNNVKPDQDDASKNGDPRDLTIICEFDDLPDEVILDDSSLTTLNGEYLLNAEGRLEIHKRYSGHLKSPKCESIEAYAIHPTIDEAKNLLQLINRNLKAHAQELGISLDGVDQRHNV